MSHTHSAWLLAALIWIGGCSNAGNPEEKSADEEIAVAAAPVVAHADTVIIDDGTGGTHMMGAIQYALGQGGQFTGALGRAEPAGPVIVYIYRSINAETGQLLTQHGIAVKENSAYLWPESAPYNAESMKRVTFLRAIDPAQSDEALADGFGLEVNPPAAAPQP